MGGPFGHPSEFSSIVMIRVWLRSSIPSIQSSLVSDLKLCTLKHNFYFRDPWQHCRLSFSFTDRTLPPASTPRQRNTRPLLSPYVQSLAKGAEHYLGIALAQSTEKTYRSGMRQFFTFCSQININPHLSNFRLLPWLVLCNIPLSRTICRQSKITTPVMATSFL